jgi:Ca2+-binding RTX toxin-like protein
MLLGTLLVGLVIASGVALAVIRLGGPGDDRLIGTNGADRLNGKGGNDSIAGLGGNDLHLYGGFGNDALSGGPGDDYITGSGINGDKGSDLLLGNAGHDFMEGGLGPDRLYGGAGFDQLDEGLSPLSQEAWRPDRSADILMGGGGSDVIVAFTGSKVKDLIRYGGGFDRVLVDKGIDRVGEDCEKVRYRPVLS